MTRRMNDVLSTGKVAKICHVAPRTVSKWFDSGDLKGYIIPGSKDRRIPLKDLIRFMKKHDMPLNDLMPNVIRVLIITNEQDTAEVLAKVIDSSERMHVTICKSSFQAGMLAQRLLPEVVLVDVETPGVCADDILNYIKSNEHMQLCKVIAIHNFISEGQRIALKNRFGHVIGKPFQVRQVIEVIDEAVAVMH